MGEAKPPPAPRPDVHRSVCRPTVGCGGHGPLLRGYARFRKYMAKTLWKPYTTCGGWANVVYDGIKNAKPQCHTWNLVMSKEPAGFGLFDAGWPAHAATAIKPCDGGWEKGSILDAWPSGYLKVLPWNNWKTTYGLKFTPSFAFEYSEHTEQTGSCSL